MRDRMGKRRRITYIMLGLELLPRLMQLADPFVDHIQFAPGDREVDGKDLAIRELNVVEDRWWCLDLPSQTLGLREPLVQLAVNHHRVDRGDDFSSEDFDLEPSRPGAVAGLGSQHAVVLILDE